MAELSSSISKKALVGRVLKEALNFNTNLGLNFDLSSAIDFPEAN
jgi:hypothetical protein